ncbi:hypothetical protein ACE6H2_012156 [Prunus campanulata]
MNQQLPVETQFVSKLADKLNAEIVLGTVQNAREASNWLTYTYLYVRMLKEPALYGLEADVLTRASKLEERRADLIHSAATILDKNGLIKYERKSGYFQVTDLGRIASYYYVTPGTISTYNELLKPTMGQLELFRLFSLSDEFKYVTVRRDEKMELAQLLDCVPVPVNGSVEEPSDKINVLLQAYISCLKLEGLSLTSNMVFITQNAGRLPRAIFELVLKRGWAQVAEKALNLCKMVEKRMWGVQTPLRQFNVLTVKLERIWIGRAHAQPITCTVLKIELDITPDFQWDDKFHGYVEPFWVILEDNNGEYILHHEYFLLKQYINEDHTLIFTAPIYEPLPPQYFIQVVSDRWLRSETVLPVSFKHLMLPEKNPPPTELLDLQPLPVAALRNPLYEALYDHDFKCFNPIQTQVFTILYNSDDNVLVAASTGSGKTLCADIAVLRNHQKGTQSDSHAMRVVYMAPSEALANERYRDLERKFGKGLKLCVGKLIGERSRDLKQLQKCHIIISTPENWDALSRRWKQNKNVQHVSLFIVDELHLIGGQGGPVLEAIVSRMRYISSQTENKILIVALSTSLANAKDLGEWIGATSHGLFNFPPDSGEKPLFLLRPLDGHIESLIGRLNDEILQSILRDDGPFQSPLLDDSGKCVILCHAPHKEYYKKFLYEALPVESHMHHYLHDNLNAEIVNGIIRSKQDAVDHLTWTFLYKRLTQNPNYYNLQGVSQRHLSEHLSELVETTLSDLEASQCIAIDDDMKLSPLVLGLAASYFYISYSTVDLFESCLIPQTRMKGLVEILAQASEYSQLPIRSGEEEVVRRLIKHQRFSLQNPKCTEPHVKANALLQAHFSRQLVGENLILDQQEVILSASRLVPAMVDIICNHGWLSLAILVMELSQMMTQGMWHSDSELLQLPHFTKELAKRCRENPGKSVEKVFDLKGMEADERRKLLEMSDTQMVDVERFCNQFPEIDMECGSAKAGEDERITLQVTLGVGHQESLLGKPGKCQA